MLAADATVSSRARDMTVISYDDEMPWTLQGLKKIAETR